MHSLGASFGWSSVCVLAGMPLKSCRSVRASSLHVCCSEVEAPPSSSGICLFMPCVMCSEPASAPRYAPPSSNRIQLPVMPPPCDVPPAAVEVRGAYGSRWLPKVDYRNPSRVPAGTGMSEVGVGMKPLTWSPMVHEDTSLELRWWSPSFWWFC